jgi:hypothetical protein
VKPCLVEEADFIVTPHPGLPPTSFHAAGKLERASRAFSRRNSGGKSPSNGPVAAIAVSTPV